MDLARIFHEKIYADNASHFPDDEKFGLAAACKSLTNRVYQNNSLQLDRKIPQAEKVIQDSEIIFVGEGYTG